MSDFWADKKKRLEEIARCRSRGLSWREIKEELQYPGETVTLRSMYSSSDVDRNLEDSVENYTQKVKAQDTAKKERKLSKAIAKSFYLRDDLLDQIKKELKGVKLNIKSVKLPPIQKGMPMICEVLLSDLQIGKVTPDFNTEIAMKRLEAHGRAVLLKLSQHMKNGYKPQKIVLACIGDIIESAEKAAQKNTPLSVDTTTAEQIVMAVKGIYQHILVPLLETGIKIDFIGVPGNHDHRNSGMVMDEAGKVCDTWVVYNMLQMLAEQNYKNITFNITKGMYALTDIFGATAIYEHGYGISVAESALLNRVNQRMRQEKRFIPYFRMGDKHSITTFNENQLVVNGAYFGASEGDKGHDYSSAMGFSAKAAQICFFHVPRKDERLTCYDTFIIQLCHIK